MTNQAPHSSGSKSDRPFLNSLLGLLKELAQGFSKLIGKGNNRQLIVRNATNRTLLRIPLTLAVILGLVLVWRAAPLLIVAFIVALFLKVQFIIATDLASETAPPAAK
jgi:fatty acid desaturase